MRGAQVYMYPSKLDIQLSVHYVQLNIILVGVQLSPLVCWKLLLGTFSVSEKLDTVHKVYDRRGGAQVYMYPSKLAIQLSVQYVQAEFNNKHTSGGCTTKPFCSAGSCWAPLVSVKIWMSHTKCTIEEGSSSIHVPFKISYTTICTVRTAEFNDSHTSCRCTTKPLGV